MLKGISPLISPELMKTLMEMGHGDEIVFADGNFPAAANAKHLIRYDGHNVTELLAAVMQHFPLERSTDRSAAVMATAANDAKPPIWDSYYEIIKKYEEDVQGFEYVERFAFYARARQAYAIVATSEKALRANLILVKGVVRS